MSVQKFDRFFGPDLVKIYQILFLRLSIYSDSKWNKVQHECIKCLKAIMNNKVGLKDMFEHKEALTLLARSMQPNLPHVMQEAVKLMAAICIVPPDGHARTIEAITIASEMRGTSGGIGDRFQPIVQGLLVRNEQVSFPFYGNFPSFKKCS